jgi:hypothetical protein
VTKGQSATKPPFRGFPPVAATLLGQRAFTGTVCIVLVVLALASTAGFSLWHCPIKQSLGVPCPGCGLTRGSLATLKGDFATAIDYHWFSPFMLAFWVFVAVALAVPAPYRDALSGKLEKIERRTGLVLFPMAACLIYGLTRMAIACYKVLSSSL